MYEFIRYEFTNERVGKSTNGQDLAHSCTDVFLNLRILD